MVLYDPDSNGMPSLYTVDPSTLTGNAVYAKCSQAKFILDGAKETTNLTKQ
jgi:hypothetical protein